MWADITPEMMSDEELDSTGKVYIRHPPSYRSDVLNKFITKLDSRCSESKATHPRMERIQGSPTNKAVPKHIPKWTAKSSQDENETPATQATAEALTSDDNESDLDSNNVNSLSDSSLDRIMQSYK